MKMRSICAGVAAIAVYFSPGRRQDLLPPAPPRSRREMRHQGKGSGASPKAAHLTKDEIVAKYVKSCLAQPAKEEECGKIRKDAVEIVKEDLHTLGSSAESHVHAHHPEDFQERRCGVADCRGGRYRHDRPSG